MLTNDTILQALAAVAGPDGRTPLPQGGAIAGISIRGDKVFMAINVPADAAQALAPMRAAAISSASHSTRFTSHTATRSPGPIPAERNQAVMHCTCCASAATVVTPSPCTKAGACGSAARRACISAEKRKSDTVCSPPGTNGLW